jgi:hypothetical protein
MGSGEKPGLKLIFFINQAYSGAMGKRSSTFEGDRRSYHCVGFNFLCFEILGEKEFPGLFFLLRQYYFKG